MLAQAFNPNTQEAEPVRYLGIQVHPGLRAEFQADQVYIVTP